MSQLVLKSLSILLGIFFIFLGIIKVTSYIDKDLHKDMVRSASLHSSLNRVLRNQNYSAMKP